MAMSERELLQSIKDAARQCGWRVYHTWLSAHSAKGWPDLVLLKDGRMLAWELKSEKGKLTPEQQAWLDELSEVSGVYAQVIRPQDLESAYKALLGAEVKQ